MKNDDLTQADDLQIEALSDEELEGVAGGGATDVHSCVCCTANANTTIKIGDSIQ